MIATAQNSLLSILHSRTQTAEQTVLIIKRGFGHLEDKVRQHLQNEKNTAEQGPLKIVKRGQFPASEEFIRDFYPEQADRPHFKFMLKHLAQGSGDYIVMVIEGNNAVQRVRDLAGKTCSLEAEPGTIRGDLGLHNNPTYKRMLGSAIEKVRAAVKQLCTTLNVIHTSDAKDKSAARREIEYFDKKEILKPVTQWPARAPIERS